jgi:hypothetical protein
VYVAIRITRLQSYLDKLRLHRGKVINRNFVVEFGGINRLFVLRSYGINTPVYITQIYNHNDSDFEPGML